eukprot:TRINITY_DN6289_c0_g1_i4.p2 TRINITY_DN6289_c0_g1~~TRINITY_DN6289_c0_g1_i4.p2  ORF type:complete len:105 (+),score=18.26 TRINITY_DN6289_c0_g1_i4:40-315(+)
MSAKPPVDKLYLTLRKGLAGKPRFLKNMLQTLGFHRCHETVEVKNYPSVRGVVEKVIHLVEVETDDQYYDSDGIAIGANTFAESAGVTFSI